MPVTNATFDFRGTDIATDTSIAAGGVQNGTLTEQGITFSFSSNAGLANFSSTAFGLSVSSGTAILTINDTPSEEFFSDLVFNFGSSPGGSPTFVGTNSIVLSQTKTANGAPMATAITAVIPDSQIVANGVATAPAGQWNSIQFNSPNGFMILDSITATVNCFLSGTAIATETGARAVETLKPGDLLRTADGRLEAVVWLGEMEIDTRLMHPAKVNPICITAGALGNGLPERDLHLSADHAVEIDGVLYNAGALVNGATIYRVAKMPMDGFTYYHIETQGHELLLAEGVAAESFIDYVGRDSFENGDEAEVRAIPEMDLPRVSSARLVPDHIRACLAPDAVAA
ncbi:hypothetical protein RA2_04285 [Roseovarius sp. A-2]|uniref:Hint domain-containing protein n=1 Tax=Roseovarius sp. A-2 TaxID=1570360 RepID=UPI0009C9EEC3|nr:Hint domain-containing protein [Roseovarius sp. A-2]GAW37209.1 hypothetical protein RA2_04285 [Roseovarius sp. A-2]